MPISSLAETVRSRREASHLTREHLAVAAGTSVATLVRLENEGRVPSLAILERIAEELGATVAELLAEPDAVT